MNKESSCISLPSQGQHSKWIIGVCALDTKARSKPMRNILDRLLSTGHFETIIFGDKVILDEDVETWPLCDFLISFFSAGFPLERAIKYVELRKPFCLNSLHMQETLLDRRLVLEILDKVGVPTPRRLVTWQKDFPTLRPEVQKELETLGLDVQSFRDLRVDALQIDSQTIQVGSETMKKPFVEKPVSGEDHNIYIYIDAASGGGVRKLFRKVGNKSSEYESDVESIRKEGSFIYEEFISVDNAEDVKVYTIGESYAHAETRKSPVVDGRVQRNPEGKEVRYVTPLSEEEKKMAEKITQAFGQTICGFDLLRANGRSYVIDVNGWSFVKGNPVYYDKFAKMVTAIFLNEAGRRGHISPTPRKLVAESQWRLKAFLAVMRHADRTPKQKMKFSFKSPRFLGLINGNSEELILKTPEQLSNIVETVKASLSGKEENVLTLEQLLRILDAKAHLPGTKVQIKPGFSKDAKDSGKLVKVQLIVKWGGELTHAGAHHSKDLAENLRKDLMIINKNLLDQVFVHSSTERRVLATVDSFCRSLLGVSELPREIVHVDRDMLDDSNAAKVQMDHVKARWQTILNPDHPATVPSEFVMPPGLTDLGGLVHEIVEILQTMRKLLRQNTSSKDLNRFQSIWCCDESPFLFIERWEKLFRDFCDVEREKFEPSKVSELYDSIKYDLLHNREFFMGIFSSPGQDLVRQLCEVSRTLFYIIGPHEYGIEKREKLDIGVRNTQYLLRQLYNDLISARDLDTPSTRFYFTKESKVICLLNVVLLSGLRTKMETSDIRELDYLTQISFEVYERNTVSFDGNDTPREYSLRIGFSPGAHDPNLIDLQLDDGHSLSVAPRRWISDHIQLEEALKLLNFETLAKMACIH